LDVTDKDEEEKGRNCLLRRRPEEGIAADELKEEKVSLENRNPVNNTGENKSPPPLPPARILCKR